MKGIKKSDLFAKIFLMLMLLIDHGIIIVAKADNLQVSGSECTEKPQEKKSSDKHSPSLTEIEYKVSYEEVS